MMNRRLGYLILMFIVAAVAGLCAYVADTILNPAHLRVVTFSSAANLRIEDPVKMQGAEVGYVEDMQSNGKHAVVTLRFFEKLPFYSDYRIETVDKGIMGQRIVTVDPGTASLPLISPSDTLRGYFRPGISELVGQAWKLKSMTGQLMQISNKLLYGTESHESLITRYNSIVDRTDNITRQVANLVTSLNKTVGDQVFLLDSILLSAEELITASAAVTPEYIDTIEKQLEKIFTALVSLQTLSNDIEEVISVAENKEGLVMGNQVSSLKQTFERVNELADQIRLYGMNLKVILSLRR